MIPLDLTYPFVAVVGQDQLKRALLMNAVCPALGGLLIAGDRGTAKTTAARALAALLPRLAVVASCPFRCDPAAVWPDCPHCRGSADLDTEEVAAPFVELPLGATEDRVAGSVDIERTLREGRPAFRPGLLAAAHRGILYIDEVNLLADHLVDLLLDTAASGIHCVEREGITVRHPARFILVGTMNPEEGELRPQLADRFALRVNIRTPAASGERTEVVRRRQAFDADPFGFCSAWAEEQRQLADAISRGRAVFSSVALTDEQLDRIAKVCSEHHVEGLRADLAVGRGARALAALAGRTQVTTEDLQDAAELALPHRSRHRPAQPPPAEEVKSRDWFGDGQDAGSPQDPAGKELPGPVGAGEAVAPPGPTARLPQVELTEERRAVEADRGRRLPLAGQPRGRYVRAVRDEAAGTVAIDATLRAAALRDGLGGGGFTVRPEDLHWKQREDQRGSLIVFVVDASGSMGARRRMEAVKAVALALLADAGRLRDDVALIAVRGPRAECLLPPTPDARVAEQALARLPTGGRTPLAHGLALATQLHQSDARPMLLVIVSDGKANVPLPGTDGDPWAQVLEACAGIATRRLRALVVDAEEGVVQAGRARELAVALGAECLPLAALSATGVGELLRAGQTSSAAGEV
jgi:magnesium chelatase subunit D